MNIDAKILNKILQTELNNTLKDHTPGSSGIYPRDARIDQYPELNQLTN